MMMGRNIADLWQSLGWQWQQEAIYAQGLSADSRTVETGDLFLALTNDYITLQLHIQQAQEHKVCAVVVDERFTTQVSADGFTVKILFVANLYQHRAAIATHFYQNPSANLLLIGITGTNGKTSVSHFIAQALDQLYKPCGVIGTTGHGMLKNLKKATNTTPDSPLTQSLLADIKLSGGEVCAMEVSSHALDQQRVDGCEFDVAVFTNLSRDHLDYHETMTVYKDAKAKLFAWPHLKHVVFNVDDAFGKELSLQPTNARVWTYSLKRSIPEVDVALVSSRYTEQGLQAKLMTISGEINIDTPLMGQFNLLNIMAAVTSLMSIGYSAMAIEQTLISLMPVMGRMERFSKQQSPTIVVDYAHTPDALKSALQALRRHRKTGKVWCVFGCGGSRDTGKRPIMASIAEQLSDCVVVTDDNPRLESSKAIIGQIMTGFKEPEKATVIADRAAAITFTLQQAQPGDIVLVAGKGHEEYQEIGTQRFDFSDRQHIQKILAENYTCASL